jgi:iron complex transport system substrate-binding protein
MRIASLIPSATELLFAIGLGDRVVAVGHDCDHPPDATGLPQLTASVIPAGLPPAEVDAFVRGLVEQGEALHTLDEELLLEEEPDVIFTQRESGVGAVALERVEQAAARLDPSPRIVTLDPATFGEALGGIGTVAEAAGEPELGAVLAGELADRVDAVQEALGGIGDAAGPNRVVTATLEWIDPLLAGGLWIPQMIELAGGVDLLGMPGEAARETDWSELAAIAPEVIVLAQCGYNAARSAEEAEDFAAELGSTGARRILAADSACFTRPGPRLVDGLELLAHALHPELVPEPAAGAMIELAF